MMQLGFYFDVTRCTGCQACEVACKAEHHLEPRAEARPGSTGPRWRQVLELETDGAVAYMSLSCLHCGHPECMQACPTGAISKDPETGIVRVATQRCIGCRYCSWACPFGAPQFGSDGLMQKCDLCSDRLAEGLEPACVEACTTGALQWGEIGELEEMARRRSGQRFVGATSPLLTPR